MAKKLLDTFGGQVLGSGATGLLGGAADAIFGGVSARRNWKYQQKAMAQQQQYNLENMERQFEYQQRAWRMENEYNDPRNAVARWRAAGIAPQAVYGSSPGGSGVAGSMSTPDSSSPNASSPGGSHGYAPVMTLAESMRLRNERKIADATVDKLSAEADKLRGDTKDSDETKRAQTLLNRAAELENDNKSLQNEILSIQRDFEERKQTGVLGDLNARIDELISRKDLNEESRQNLIETRDLIKAQTDEAKARTDESKARTTTERELLRLRKSLTHNQINKITQEIRQSRVLTAEGIERLYAWLTGDRDASSLFGVVDKYLTGAGKDLLKSRYNNDIREYLYKLAKGSN